MINSGENGENVRIGLQRQSHPPEWFQEVLVKKRPLCNRTLSNGTASDHSSPDSKKVKTDTTSMKKQSTPLKRTPKLEVSQTCSSDFSDWDESPIKQVLHDKNSTLSCDLVAEKENSEFEDSFDEPVFAGSPKKRTSGCTTHVSAVKRSPALRLFDDRSSVANGQISSRSLSLSAESGIPGFPSLSISNSEVELTVKDVKREDGVVDLVCKSKNGQESIVYLQDQWAEMLIEPNTQIRLIGAQRWGTSDWLLSNEKGILIVDPDILVPCTGIASSTWCSRKVVLNERFRGPVEANKAMLIGVIVHELFQAAIRCQNVTMVTTDWLLKQWRDCLCEEVVGELAALRLTPSQVETELMPYADVVVDWVQSNIPGGSSYPASNAAYQVVKVHDIEENIWNPQLGIKGKIDVTLETKTNGKILQRPLELKTGKSGPSSDHAAQVMLYNLMLSSRYKQPIGNGSLLYLKDGVTREVRPRALELKGIINQRNNLAFYMSRLKPDLLPEPRSDPRFCGKCEQAPVCSFYQVAMEPAGRSSKLMYDFAKANMRHLSATHLEYFKKWVRWIYFEWAEDKSRKGSKLQDLWRKLPEEREADGFCASSLRLTICIDKSTETSSSFLLTFESSGKISSTTFSPGNMCTVSTTTKPGILLVPVIESSPTSVTVRSDKMLDREEVYHLDLYNSFSTYSTTLGSLTLLMGSDERSTHLRELIVNVVTPSSVEPNPATLPLSVRMILSENVLNEEQREAVRSALLCSDYTLIEGFPGSGKTTTIVALLRCLLEMNCSVLLTANTHSALDNVLAKLRKYVDASKLLRLGKLGSGRKVVADLTLQSKLKGILDEKYTAARDILKNTPLVASTCHNVPRELLFSWRKFDCCVVDEASMVLEPVLLPSLAVTNRFILVGDAHQLAPIVQNNKCADEGMSVSLFERLQIHKSAVHSLVSQYRMNSVIAKLSSELFYEDRLVCGTDEVSNACLSVSQNYHTSCSEGDSWNRVESGALKDSVVFIDTRARIKPEFAMSNDGAGLTYNTGEAELVCETVKRFLKNGVPATDIGVMCVYRKQVDVLKSMLDPTLNIEINSVDQYQGRDKSVIIWSLVWTDSSVRRCELLRDQRRINVALTRAKHKLILIGCAESMRSMDVMKRVLDRVAVIEL